MYEDITTIDVSKKPVKAVTDVKSLDIPVEEVEDAIPLQKEVVKKKAVQADIEDFTKDIEETK